MRKTLILTGVLLSGLVSSQLVPALMGELPAWFVAARHFAMMGLLAHIMIEVGREFDVDLGNKRQYAVDYLVAATAAAFPWLLVTGYFLLFLMPSVSATGRAPWMEALLAGRFAAPTSAGVLFTMLASAGLAGTWVFRKTRILAIFDDLDTVLLMIPIKILIVGFVWQLSGALVVLAAMLVLGWKAYRKLRWPATWPWILVYAFAITAFCEGLYHGTKDPATGVGLALEVLLPAFLLGCALKTHSADGHADGPGENPSGEGEAAAFVISCGFMFLVGFSLPPAFGASSRIAVAMSAWELGLHVVAVTVISNIGKMFVCFCYGSEASFRERLAVSIALFPRGEVGAGVLAVSLGYGIAGPFVTVAFLSLSLNLVLTGAFIVIVKRLLAPSARELEVTGGSGG